MLEDSIPSETVSEGEMEAVAPVVSDTPRRKRKKKAAQQLRKTLAPDGKPYLLNIPGGKLYLVRRPEGTYKWVEGAHAASTLEDMWPDREWRKETKTGDMNLLSLGALMSAYGYTVDDHHYTWTQKGEEFYIDSRGVSRLQIVCGVEQDIEPVFHADCEEWIERVGAERVDQMRDWLSVVRRLDEAVAALYVMGPGGIGKGMLALALAQLFGGAVAKYKNVVIDNFNEALVYTPVLFLNEKAPVTTEGSSAFRDIIGSNRYQLTQKFKAASTINVAPRVLICANNADALRLGNERMEAADEAAIGRRIIFIEVPDSTLEWMKEQGGPDFTENWIEYPDGSPGKLVEHIQWYVENWNLSQKYHHMIVDGNNADWKRLTHRRGGIGESIFGAIAMALCKMVEIPDSQSPVDVNAAGEVLVKARPMANSWKILTHSPKSISYHVLGKELGKLAEGDGKSKHRTFLGTKHQRVHIFSARTIYEAAEEAGVVELDHLAERLGLTFGDNPDVDG